MNKDMMNIDDFVREKLNGHSEKENPEAWLRMKDLLDKEMPEKAAPFYFRMGKPMAFLGAALLIGALCVGGYKVNSIREKSNANSSVKPSQNNNTKANTTTADNNFAENNNLKDNNITAASGDNNTVNNATGATANTNTNTTNQKNNNAPNNKGNTVNNNNKTIVIKDVASADNSTNTAASSNKQTAAKRNHNRRSSTLVASAGANKKAQQNVNLANNLKKAEAKNTGKTVAVINDNDAENVAQNRVADDADQKGKTLAKNKKKQMILASGASASSSSKKNKAPRKIKNAKANKEAGSMAVGSIRTAEKSVRSDNKSDDKDVSTDSIAAYTVITKESTSRGFPKKTTRIIDTIDKTKIAMPYVAENKAGTVNNTIVGSTKPTKKEIKLAAAESKKANKTSSKKEAEHQKNILAANNNNLAKQAGVTAQTETVIKLKKEKSSLSKWIEGLNLPEAISSAKQDAHNATFFFGVEAGGNYSFPKNGNNFQGVQFGVTGELVFNKHWSLFGAVKYFNRSGGKKVVNDNFAAQIADRDSVQGANWYHTVRTDSTNRYFNFSTVHSFEMPVTLRYTVNKFYIMTGINLAYYLPINVELIEKEYNNRNIHTVVTNSSKPILTETKPLLSTNDFGSRFGLGYVIGAGYQITPAWQVDFRLVNSFWDNANGAPAQQVSKDFYRLPSVQLSFGYQFNKARSKATFGPNSNR